MLRGENVTTETRRWGDCGSCQTGGPPCPVSPRQAPPPPSESQTGGGLDGAQALPLAPPRWRLRTPESRPHHACRMTWPSSGTHHLPGKGGAAHLTPQPARRACFPRPRLHPGPHGRTPPAASSAQPRMALLTPPPPASDPGGPLPPLGWEWRWLGGGHREPGSSAERARPASGGCGGEGGRRAPLRPLLFTATGASCACLSATPAHGLCWEGVPRGRTSDTPGGPGLPRLSALWAREVGPPALR